MIEQGPGNNAQQGEDCCDELYPDDGRIDDGKHEDWGSHSHADWLSENTDYYDEG